jgi:hypothetical protein
VLAATSIPGLWVALFARSIEPYLTGVPVLLWVGDRLLVSFAIAGAALATKPGSTLTSAPPRGWVVVGISVVVAEVSIAVLSVLALVSLGNFLELTPSPRIVGAGHAFRTQSGLTLTVPQGTSAKVTGSLASLGDDGPHEFVVIKAPDGSWTAYFASYSQKEALSLPSVSSTSTASGQGTSTVLASTDDSRVVVISGTSPTNVVIRTTLPKALPGTAMFSVENTRTLTAHGLTLVRLVWNALRIRGATTP